MIFTYNVGDLRLAESVSGNDGRLEIYINGSWGTVCDNAFDKIDAVVACRQLGYRFVYLICQLLYT